MMNHWINERSRHPKQDTMEFSVAADSKKNDIVLAKVRAQEDTSISRKNSKKSLRMKLLERSRVAKEINSLKPKEKWRLLGQKWRLLGSE